LSAEWKTTRQSGGLVQEFVESAGIRGISDLAGSRIKKFSNVAEIDVRKNRDHAELAQDRQKILDHARAAEWTRGHSANTSGLVDVFLQIAVEDMLQQTWKTVIVLRDNEYERVRVVHHL